MSPATSVAPHDGYDVLDGQRDIDGGPPPVQVYVDHRRGSDDRRARHRHVQTTKALDGGLGQRLLFRFAGDVTLGERDLMRHIPEGIERRLGDVANDDRAVAARPQTAQKRARSRLAPVMRAALVLPPRQIDSLTPTADTT